MIKIATSMILAASFAFATAQEGNSIAGKWKVHGSIAGNDSDMECTITQTNNDLSGTCTSAQGDLKIAGKVDGKKVNWSYDSEYNGSPLTVKYSGTLDSGKITGTMSVEQFGVEGDFTATSVN